MRRSPHPDRPDPVPAGWLARQSADRRVVLAAASRLLRYPDQGLLDDLPLLGDTVAAVGGDPGRRLGAFVTHARSTSLLDLQRDYVATFDLKRRCCLYLTYFLNGDTRRRGMALWRFGEEYRRAGLRVDSGELPDYLPMVLEFAAAGDGDAGLLLLAGHREGIEVLREALIGLRSAHADVVAAVLAVLPHLSAGQRAAVRALAEQGPPTELVGLAPFGAELVSGARA